MYGENNLTSAPQSKGSEVIANLYRIIMVLIDKVVRLESANIILVAEVSSVDKALLEMRRQEDLRRMYGGNKH